MKRVATIGFFDGVHLGHQYLCRQLKELVGDRDRAIAITFSQHPQRVLGRADAPKLLTTNNEKKYLLENLCGIDHVEFLDFDRPMASLTAEEFMNHYLHDTFGITHLLVGYDHHFGRPRWGEDFEQYKEYGQELGIEVICAKEFPERKVSSSRIRRAMAAGNMEEANLLLGYTYNISGTVEQGEQVGRKLGFPTANLHVNDPLKMLPANGVYVSTVHIDGIDFPAVTNIGNRPTLHEEGALSIESHFLESHFENRAISDDLYGHNMTLYLHARLREEIKFESSEALQSQIQQDVNSAIAYHRQIKG